MKRLILGLIFFYCLESSCQIHGIKREFRGVWIATVENIDWPGKGSRSSETQKAELLSIFDEHKKTGINAVMFQVRPTADALYKKSREPWSRYLSGKPGIAPDPEYDPLQFAIEKAHERGMELHAWFNPYRATNDMVAANVANDHISLQKPEWFFTYGSKKYFNPGLQEVRSYIVSVILDVVDGYDIDGVHFDDYFYPYPGKTPLPDSLTFLAHSRGISNIEDWRRDNVNLLIKEVRDSIKAHKKHVKFGISPFGIWRNKKEDVRGSETNGLSGYSALYADALHWLANDWIDYINPQVYFPFKYAPAAFEVLTDWWGLNSFGKHVYIGNAVYRASEKRFGWESFSQLPDQIRYLRNNEHIQGSVFFSSKSLTDNLAGFRDSLRHDFYKYPALVPTMPWIDNVAPKAPEKLTVKRKGKRLKLSWTAPEMITTGSDDVYGYVIYRVNKRAPLNTLDPGTIIHISFDNKTTYFLDDSSEKGSKYYYFVTVLDRMKNESATSNVVLKGGVGKRQ